MYYITDMNILLFAILMAIGHAQTLQSLISLAQILDDNNTNITTDGSINIIVDNSNGVSIPLVYLPYMAFFSREDGSVVNNNEVYEGLAAISLALEHLNTGNGTIVSELSGLNDRCPLQFYTESWDTEGTESASVNTIIELTEPSPDERDYPLFPSSFVTATGSPIAMMTSVISGIRQVPQVSALATSALLDDSVQYQLFGRTIPNDSGTSIPLMEGLSNWGVNYLGVLHINDLYGNSFADSLRQAALPFNITVVAVNVRI